MYHAVKEICQAQTQITLSRVSLQEQGAGLRTCRLTVETSMRMVVACTDQQASPMVGSDGIGTTWCLVGLSQASPPVLQTVSRDQEKELLPSSAYLGVTLYDDRKRGLEGLLCEQDIARLDVQVSNALAVQVRQAPRHVCGNLFAPATPYHCLIQPSPLHRPVS